MDRAAALPEAPCSTRIYKYKFGILMMRYENIELRWAVESDCPALIDLLRRAWFTTWAPEVPLEAVRLFATKDPARDYAETAWPSFRVATLDGVLVGMVQVADDCVESLHVDPRRWDKGIGSRLMDDADGRIGASHASAWLEVRAFNTRGRRFYARRGWVEGRHYPGTECGSPVENVEMRKALQRG